MISRAGTPKPVIVKDGEAQSGETAAEKPAVAAMEPQPEENRDSEKMPQEATLEVPTDVRVKLRKLERLESRYQGIPCLITSVAV